MNRPASRNTYLVMTQQVPNRTFEVVEATTIAEAARQGIVMLLVRSGQQET